MSWHEYERIYAKYMKKTIELTEKEKQKSLRNRLRNAMYTFEPQMELQIQKQRKDRHDMIIIDKITNILRGKEISRQTYDTIKCMLDDCLVDDSYFEEMCWEYDPTTIKFKVNEKFIVKEEPPKDFLSKKEMEV